MRMKLMFLVILKLLAVVVRFPVLMEFAYPQKAMITNAFATVKVILAKIVKTVKHKPNKNKFLKKIKNVSSKTVRAIKKQLMER